MCEFCEEHVKDTELSVHDCSHKEYSMFIFNQGMKDELMVIVYYENTEEAHHEADEVQVGDLIKMEQNH